MFKIVLIGNLSHSPKVTLVLGSLIFYLDLLKSSSTTIPSQPSALNLQQGLSKRTERPLRHKYGIQQGKNDTNQLQVPIIEEQSEQC